MANTHAAFEQRHAAFEQKLDAVLSARRDLWKKAEEPADERTLAAQRQYIARAMGGAGKISDVARTSPKTDTEDTEPLGKGEEEEGAGATTSVGLGAAVRAAVGAAQWKERALGDGGFVVALRCNLLAATCCEVWW